MSQFWQFWTLSDQFYRTARTPFFSFWVPPEQKGFREKSRYEAVPEDLS